MTMRSSVGLSCGHQLSAAATLAALMLASAEPASACRGIRNWSSGDDLSKLRPGEFVVYARLLETYQSQEPMQGTIMGNPHGMIYAVQIADVRGGPGATAEVRRIVGTKIFIHLAPSVCEAYFPDKFSPGSARSLVLKKGDAGLVELVGGQ